MESLIELQPQEPEVQIFVTADNTKCQELCGITLSSDVLDKVERKEAQQSHNSIVELKELPSQVYIFGGRKNTSSYH